MRPHAAGEAHAGLHLVEDEQRLIFVREVAQRPQELGTEMIVAALGLDGLDEDAGDVVLALAIRGFPSIDFMTLPPSRPSRRSSLPSRSRAP
jgi:hypothetical protein